MNEHWITSDIKRGFRAISDFWPIISNGQGYIGGSYAAFMAAPIDNPIQPNDIDIFARSVADADCLQEAFFRMGYATDARTPIAVSLSYPGRIPVQIVKPDPDWKTFPDDVMESFDLDVCRAMLISDHVIVCDKNVGLRTAKVLRINNPLRTLRRIVKYQARGVEFSDWEVLKVFQAWEHLSDTKKGLMLDAAVSKLDPDVYPENYDDWEEADDEDWWDGE